MIGESHLVYQGNKTDSDDFLYFDFVGLAEELKFRGLHEAEVVLAVGLPLAWVKSQAADWRAYLMQEKELDFMFQRNATRCIYVVWKSFRRDWRLYIIKVR